MFSEIGEIKDAQQLVFNHFEKRFYDEYLNALQERHLHQHNTSKSETDAVIGDIVIIKEAVLPTIIWRKGPIID